LDCFGAYDAYATNLGYDRARTTYNVTRAVAPHAGIRPHRWNIRPPIAGEVSSSTIPCRTLQQVKLGVTDRLYEVVDVRGELEKIVDRNYRSADSPPNTLQRRHRVAP